MTNPTPEPKITKLPRNGPKPGQSVDHWLHGKAMGDRQWQKKIEAADRLGKYQRRSR